jgi:thymidylate synthase
LGKVYGETPFRTDAHIYNNQIKGVKEQLSRDSLPLPKLWLNLKVSQITDFTMDIDQLFVV